VEVDQAAEVAHFSGVQVTVVGIVWVQMVRGADLGFSHRSQAFALRLFRLFSQDVVEIAVFFFFLALFDKGGHIVFG